MHTYSHAHIHTHTHIYIYIYHIYTIYIYTIDIYYIYYIYYKYYKYSLVQPCTPCGAKPLWGSLENSRYLTSVTSWIWCFFVPDLLAADGARLHSCTLYKKRRIVLPIRLLRQTRSIYRYTFVPRPPFCARTPRAVARPRPSVQPFLMFCFFLSPCGGKPLWGFKRIRKPSIRDASGKRVGRLTKIFVDRNSLRVKKKNTH